MPPAINDILPEIADTKRSKRLRAGEYIFYILVNKNRIDKLFNVICNKFECMNDAVSIRHTYPSLTLYRLSPPYFNNTSYSICSTPFWLSIP